MECGSDIRVWAYIVAIAMYFLFQFPAPTLIIFLLVFVLYIFANGGLGGEISLKRIPREVRIARLAALECAAMYLAPYKDIWKNLRLSNKNCSLYLANDGVTIIAKELNNEAGGYRTFTITKYKTHNVQQVWDMFCINFDHFTNYNGLVEYSRNFGVDIRQKYVKNQSRKTIEQISQKSVQKNANIEKVDINNASEVEITALPGISIVLSKRIIKKREEIRGFKSLDDLFLFLKLKPHMQEQLRNLVSVNKMKGSLSVERFKERNIDL